MNQAEDNDDNNGVRTGPPSQEGPFSSPPASNGTSVKNSTKSDNKRGDAIENMATTTTITTNDAQHNLKLITCKDRIHRRIRYFISHWPRTIAVLSKMFSLWTLICWSLALGFALATLESPQEIISNDAIVASSFVVSNLPVNQTMEALVSLPTTCTAKFLTAYNESGKSLGLATLFNDTTDFNYSIINLTWNGLAFPVETFLEVYHPNVSLPNVTIRDQVSLADLYEYLVECEELTTALLRALAKDSAEVAVNIAQATQTLTFNWIRCWNSSDPDLGIDRSPWVPNQAQINASANQSGFFRDTWLQSRESLQQQYEEEWNCTGDVQNMTKCQFDARNVSIQDASGGDGCGDNTGASAWFWFTVMTSKVIHFLCWLRRSFVDCYFSCYQKRTSPNSRFALFSLPSC